MANIVLNKGKSATSPASSASDEAKTFQRTLIFMTQVSLYLFSSLELI